MRHTSLTAGAPADRRRGAQHRQRDVSRIARAAPSPRLAGQPDPGDAAVAAAVAAAHARFEAARCKLAAARAAKAAAEAKAHGPASQDGKRIDGRAAAVRNQSRRMAARPRFGWSAPAAWRLSARASDLVYLLALQSWPSSDALARALYGAEYRASDAGDVTGLLADVRADVAPHGVTIPRRGHRNAQKQEIPRLAIDAATRKAWGLPP